MLSALGEIAGELFEIVGEVTVVLTEMFRRSGTAPVRESEFEFRRFGPPHVTVMYEWLCRPHVAEQWGDLPSLEQVRDHYLRDPTVQAYIVYRAGQPMAFVQSYVAMNVGGGWWPNETDPGVVGVDLFIADP